MKWSRSERDHISFATGAARRARWELDDWWFMRPGRLIRAARAPAIRVIEVAATSERAPNVPKFYFAGGKVGRAPAWSAEALLELAEHHPIEVRGFAARAAPARGPGWLPGAGWRPSRASRGHG